jgi:hypothetical protein
LAFVGLHFQFEKSLSQAMPKFHNICRKNSSVRRKRINPFFILLDDFFFGMFEHIRNKKPIDDHRSSIACRLAQRLTITVEEGTNNELHATDEPEGKARPCATARRQASEAEANT